MKTGTDISLTECRASGYPVVEHGKRPLKPAVPYRLTISNPQFWLHGQLKIGTRPSEAYAVNGNYSYQYLWESFERGGQGIKSFCDFEHCPFPSPDENPTYLAFVSLAQTVLLYHGLD